MARRPRIMFLATTSWTGGAERQVHDLAVAMRSSGWDVSAVSMLPLGDSFADLPASGITIASLEMRQGIADPRGFLRLAALVRERRPDVLHAHMIHANLLARLSRLIRPDTVVVCTMHSQYQGGRWRMAAYRVTDRLSDATTAVSVVAREDAIHQGAVRADRVATLPNGIDLTRYHRDPGARERLRHELGLGERFVWLAVGRIAAPKDYPNLIDAFAMLHAERKLGSLLIAGGGLQDELRARIRETELGEQVRLLGMRSDVPELMSAADGFVMSSAWEGLPLVLLEAGASSLPIVATDVGGNREAVVDAATGFIVRPKDPGALARSMGRIMDLDAAGRTAMGRAARTHVASRFEIGVIAQEWRALYGRLLRQRGGQRLPGLE